MKDPVGTAGDSGNLREMRLRRLARLAFFAALPLGLVLATGPRFWGQGLVVGELPLDHVIAFALLAIVAATGFGHRLSSPLIGLLLLIVGVILEGLQLGLAHRSGTLRDLGLDLVGILIGLVIYHRLLLPRLRARG